MRRSSFFIRLIPLIVLGAAVPSFAVEDVEELWPCIQRRVPELSLPQIWNGPELPTSASEWTNAPEVRALVPELAARRVPIENAEQTIRDFAARLSGAQREERLMMLVRGLFDQMNAERSQVMAGIERYTRRQVEMADTLRKETAEVDALRSNPQLDPNEVARRTMALDFETRVFHERAQSLTYVCEVPTIIEQRLYRLANTIASLIATR